MTKYYGSEYVERIHDRFERLYGEAAGQCLERLTALVGRYGVGATAAQPTAPWSERSSILITYGDSIRAEGEKPLVTLRRFLANRLQGLVSDVHILPFFPSSSDGGFSVVDYREVDVDLGDWGDVEALGAEFGLMFDLVLNHCSQKSAWFRRYVTGIAPERHYFIEVDPDTDLSAVTRPRSSPLLVRKQTRHGETFVWSTFGGDQIDLNFRNPDVLFEYLDIVMSYVARGARIIRLDAVAYLWKEIGTSCTHRPETHDIVKILRDFLAMVAPRTILLTETNVPSDENFTYFGNGDEAQMIYQFSLPPLLLHGLLRGTARHVRDWVMELKEPPAGCTYFNFTASHDGIGVRPLEGLLPDTELDFLLEAVKERGGQVSMRVHSDGSESPYELNITYFDALSDPSQQHSTLQIERFLCSQAVALSLQGVPGVYIHSLVATRNDHEAVERLGCARAINRRKWTEPELLALLDDPTSAAALVFETYTRLLELRREEPAFHPEAAQRIWNVGDDTLAVERRAGDNAESGGKAGRRSVVMCLFNFTNETVEVDLTRTGCDAASGAWVDLIESEETLDSAVVPLRPYGFRWLRRACDGEGAT